VQEAGAEVLGMGDDRRPRRSDERQRHLVDDVLDRLAVDLGLERVVCHAALSRWFMSRSRTLVTPAGTRIVVSPASAIAGPETDEPGVSCASSYTGTSACVRSSGRYTRRRVLAAGVAGASGAGVCSSRFARRPRTSTV